MKILIGLYLIPGRNGEFSHKLVTFFSNMAKVGDELSQAALKRKLGQLSSDIFQIDLQIHKFCQ